MKFHTRKKLLDNLAVEPDATSIKKFEIYVFLCLVSELLARLLVRLFTMVCKSPQ